jgi:hypothetical protein
LLNKKYKKSYSFWKNLSVVERISVVFMFFLFLTLPLSVFAVIYPRKPEASQAFSSPKSTPGLVVSPDKNASQSNHEPVVGKQSLKKGQVGKSYKEMVIASDSDADYMEVVIGDLPSGLKQGECYHNVSKVVSEVNCMIVGVPSKSGIYKPWVIVKDEHNSASTIEMQLVIAPKLF